MHAAFRPRFSAGPIFVIAAAFILAAPLFWDRVETQQSSISEAYENSDLYQSIYPRYHYGFTSLRDGRIPFWNSRQLCGAPFLADWQNGLFQPLNLVFLVLPTEQAMVARSYLVLFLGGAFFALFMRALGIRYTPAFIAGVSYAFSGAMSAAMSRPDTGAALALAPLVFWALREFTRHYRLSRAVLAGAVAAAWLLSGALPVVAILSAVMAVYALLLVLFPGKPNVPRAPSRAGGCIILILMALGVAAVQWAPSAAWLRTLDDPWSAVWRFGFAGSVPLTAQELLRHLLSAESANLPRVGHVGVVTLLLLPGALFHRGFRRQSAFFALALTSLILILVLLDGPLPLGLPEEALPFALPFCWSALAGIGADRLLAPRDSQRTRSLLFPSLLLLLTAGAVLWVGSDRARGVAVVFLLLYALFLLVRTRWMVAVSGIGMAATSFIALMMASNNQYMHPIQDAEQRYDRYATAITKGREYAVGGRLVLSGAALDAALPANLGMIHPIDCVGGAAIPLTHGQAAVWTRLVPEGDALVRTSGKGIQTDAPAPQLLDLMAGRTIIAAEGGALYEGNWDSGGPPLRLINSIGDVRLFTNENALPRTYWTPSALSVGGIESALDTMAGNGFQPRSQCVVVGDLPEALRNAPAGDGGSVTQATCWIEPRTPERLAIRADVPGPGIVVLADTWAPGWIATLDGRATPILEVNGMFRGVAVSAGRHTIVMTYRPAAIVAGFLASLAALGVCALTGLLTLFRVVRP